MDIILTNSSLHYCVITLQFVMFDGVRICHMCIVHYTMPLIYLYVISFLISLTLNSVDRTLGGMEFQLRLRDLLARQFNQQKKTKNDVTKDVRAMQKLYKEAGRLKQVLSANDNHFAQVHSSFSVSSSFLPAFCFPVLSLMVPLPLCYAVC